MQRRRLTGKAESVLQRKEQHHRERQIPPEEVPRADEPMPRNVAQIQPQRGAKQRAQRQHHVRAKVRRKLVAQQHVAHDRPRRRVAIIRGGVPRAQPRVEVRQTPLKERHEAQEARQMGGGRLQRRKELREQLARARCAVCEEEALKRHKQLFVGRGERGERREGAEVGVQRAADVLDVGGAFEEALPLHLIVGGEPAPRLLAPRDNARHFRVKRLPLRQRCLCGCKPCVDVGSRQLCPIEQPVRAQHFAVCAGDNIRVWEKIGKNGFNCQRENWRG